jgi:hypothetical protein
LHQLERRLKPVTRELHRLQRQAEHARRLLETALTEQEQENGSSGRRKETA